MVLHVCAQQPRGGDRIEGRRERVDMAEGQLNERHEIMRALGEQRVVAGADGVAGTVCDGEGERLEPGGAALGVGGEDHVVVSGRELGAHQ
jgi:hypothetical protein